MVSWAHSPPELLRDHYARDAAALSSVLPDDVRESSIPAADGFQGGLQFMPDTQVGNAVVVYFHGGGFVAGSPTTHRAVTAWLARASRLRVLSAAYRLTPENPFPAQRDDALAAIRRGIALAGSGGVVLAGDSAGACVALWGYDGLLACEREKVRAIVSFYGGFGLADGESVARFGTAENGLDHETLRIMYARLAPASAAAPPWPHEFAHAIAAPVLIVAAGLDAVYDDSVRLARHLTPTGNHRFHVVEDQDHGFLKRAGRDTAVDAVFATTAAWLQDQLGQAEVA